MPPESFNDRLAERRRTALFLFYFSALVSAIAIALVAKVPTLNTLLFALAIAELRSRFCSCCAFCVPMMSANGR
jgi:hypothetical protein